MYLVHASAQGQYQVCVFWAYWSIKMADLASDLPRHFRLPLCNCWMEFDKTCQEASTQRHLPGFGFSDWSFSKEGHTALIGRDNFDFYSATVERNLTTWQVVSSQPLYQVCVLWGNPSTNMANGTLVHGIMPFGPRFCRKLLKRSWFTRRMSCHFVQLEKYIRGYSKFVT